ncbi:unnamed protein product [Mytilus coruscus]|uniref:Uncharacterized protein n=1 Tax=Mytilus coruscus TaxID=42192 RepID=A0A6J8CR83_MYTCO|nr:unnamed protein product [Mytilus coruscus]
MNVVFNDISEILKSLSTLIKERGSIGETISKKSVNDICIRSSEKCIQAGRNICQSLLGYPKLCALLASSVYKKMAHKVKSARDQSFYDAMMEQFRLFADRALDLQRRLYDADSNLAMDLVITEETVWDITISPLECAHENNMLDFIAQTCPQRRLNRIWYNEIGASLGGFWKVLPFFTSSVL